MICLGLPQSAVGVPPGSWYAGFQHNGCMTSTAPLVTSPLTASPLATSPLSGSRLPVSLVSLAGLGVAGLAFAGRALTFIVDGPTALGALVVLLLISVAAFAVGTLVRRTSDAASRDAWLGRITQRIGAVQTGFGVLALIASLTGLIG